MSAVEHVQRALRALARMHPQTDAEKANQAVVEHSLHCALWELGAAVPQQPARGRPGAGTGGDRRKGAARVAA